MDHQFNNLPEEENTTPTTPAEPSSIPSYTAPNEPPMQSYTAPRYDRYSAGNLEGSAPGSTNQPEKKKEPEEKKPEKAKPKRKMIQRNPKAL